MIKFSKLMALYEEAKLERYHYFGEWKKISRYLVPGRGIYSDTTKPNRRLTNKSIINNAAEDALYVLTSGMHAGLTSPSMDWFALEWAKDILNNSDQLVSWLQDCKNKVHTHLQRSNFYAVINSFYTELAAFGTACMYVGGDSNEEDTPLRFELLTAGEYCYTMDALGFVDQFFRIMYMSPAQIVSKFKNAPKEYKVMVKEKKPEANVIDRVVIEYIYKKKNVDKDYTRICYDVNNGDEPLVINGYYEMPYKVARWSTIGSDIYGLGPGSRSIPDIKRLQELEKSFLMAAHKDVEPPMLAPSRMKGKINTLPGSITYSATENHGIEELYKIQFNFAAIDQAVQRIEYRIQKTFFNDIFLTVDRSGGKSPLKAAEVYVREQEKMLRLGPVIERLQHEFLSPLVERCFNILLRSNKLPMLSPELAAIAGDYNISLVSPLATAQRSVSLQGINSFLTFIGQAAQFDQAVMDNVDIDAVVKEYSDITGVSKKILRGKEEIQNIRSQRAKAMAEEKQKQDAIEAAKYGGAVSADRAQAQKIQSEAALNQAELDKQLTQTGII